MTQFPDRRILDWTAACWVPAPRELDAWSNRLYRESVGKRDYLGPRQMNVRCFDETQGARVRLRRSILIFDAIVAG